MLDPDDPSPFVAVVSASCWAARSSAIRAAEFASWFTLIVEPCGRRTTVTPGSSTIMCRGTASLVMSSNAPCSKSLYVMLSSSRYMASGSAARASFISQKVSAVSDSMPTPPEFARPRMLPNGVSTLTPPEFAACPALTAKAPLVTLNRAEGGVPLGSQTILSSTTRVLPSRANPVPSIKRISIRPSAAVSITSPRQTGSPTIIWTAIPSRLRIGRPMAV